MRLIGLVILAISLAVAPIAADAQEARKLPRIGFLAAPSRSDRTPVLDAFANTAHRACDKEPPTGNRRLEDPGHLLHDRDGALAYERDGYRVGGHAVARLQGAARDALIRAGRPQAWEAPLLRGVAGLRAVDTAR